jgi:stage II sporulation protein D
VKKFVSVVTLLVFVLAIGGCNWFGQQKRPQSPTPPPAKQETKGGPEPNITVYMHETGEKQEMKFEEYIAGVVAGEMKNDWPAEALAAQAIVARTFTMHEIEMKGGVKARGTQASTDIKEFQAYNAKEINDNVRKAVQMSRGMVMVYQGKPALTWFHASAGGKTATAKEGLNYKEAEPPYIQAVDSPDDAYAPDEVKAWTISFTKDEMMKAMAQIGKPVSDISSVEMTQKGPSGRTTLLRINGNVDVPGPDLRVAIGSTKLRSMLLSDAKVDGDKITFSGKGYGHGVGLSQYGALTLAKAGKKPEDIVAHYFRGVTVEKRWD